MPIHPVLLLVLQILTIALVIGFTAPSSIIRIAVLPFMVLCVWQAIPTCTEHIHRAPWAAAIGGYLATFLLQYISSALLSRWSFVNRGPNPTAVASSPEQQDVKADSSYELKANNTGGKDGMRDDTRWERLKFGLQVTTSFRYSGTRHEVSNVPYFSARDPDYIPSRAVFLRRKATEFMLCYLMLDLLSLGADPGHDFSPEMIPFFARLDHFSNLQLIMRLFVTFGFGIFVYIFQQGVHCLVAFIDVGLGFSEVESWRPNFGSPRDAYTLRRFWSKVWHQNNRQKVSDLADFILFEVLHLPKYDKTNKGYYSWPSTRFLALFLNFYISGLLHAITDVASGLSWHESGAIHFFCTQALGIALEDGVQYLYRHHFASGHLEQNGAADKHRVQEFGEDDLKPLSQQQHLVTDSSRKHITKAKHHSRPSLWIRILGHTWLILFLTWSIPVWLYPTLHRKIGSAEGDSVLPFSVLRPMSSKVSKLVG